LHVKSWACEGIRKWGFEGSLRFNFSKTKSGCNIKIHKIQPPNEGKHQGKNQIFGLEKENIKAKIKFSDWKKKEENTLQEIS